MLEGYFGPDVCMGACGSAWSSGTEDVKQIALVTVEIRAEVM